jgi:uncharacterized protein
MDPVAIIRQFYIPDSPLYRSLIRHSRQVAQKSLEIADTVANQKPDRDFLENAAMLHDIGIFLTDAPSIGCTGEKPYICHGYLGKKLLDAAGLPAAYGWVCERHTGAGITRKNILSNHLPLPDRDMVPITLEEKIICVADKYFSKSTDHTDDPVSTRTVIENLNKIAPDHAQRFSAWAGEFGL